MLLEGKCGCNFRKEGVKGKEETLWTCFKDYRLSHKILDNYFPKENKEKFFNFCANNGGHCDCEILFNVIDMVEAKNVM